jgi:8-hydroxy-5-deazaflavin:NADPH oxidoreductase
MPAQTSTLPDVSVCTVGVLGGTGPLGRGLAYRLARAGQRVIIGSRSAWHGAGVAAKLAALPGAVPGVLVGGGNPQAADADVVIAALPYPARADTLRTLQARLAGRIVVDCANPLAFDNHGHPYLLPIPEGSAAEQAAALLPGSRIAAAFHHVSAELLADTAIASLGTDVLVLSDDPSAAAIVQALANRAGMHGIYAGRLDNARLVEALSVNLIVIDRWYKAAAGPRGAGRPVPGREHAPVPGRRPGRQCATTR